MKRQSFAKTLLGTTSVLGISVAAIVSGTAPAEAQAITKGIYGGGSSLASLAMRQLYDCYMGKRVGGDGYTFSLNFDANGPTPGLLPNQCRLANRKIEVQGMYAAVGSGNGRRGFIANDPKQLLLGSNGTSTPAALPPFVDNTNSNFGTYPYPRVDYGASDSPLSNVGSNNLTTGSWSNFSPAANWQTTTVITHDAPVNVTYSTATYGEPVQLPLFQVPVAIVVNTANPSTTSAEWNIQSSLETTTQPGGAMQLATAQICAIFGGLVTNWNSNALIAHLDRNGVVENQRFHRFNVGLGGGTPVRYTSSSLPIRVVFRSDGSGTTFILTQYLKSVCPQLDNGSNGYATIFGSSSLPADSFTTLKNLVEGVRPGSTATWVGADGTGSVAINVGRGAEFAGRIGYISNDFASPYATTVTGVKNPGGAATEPAPLSVSVQNEEMRVRNAFFPTTVRNFIAPTPGGARIAWQSLATPATTGTYQDWNVYAQTYSSGTSGGISLVGKSRLGLPTAKNAYPIVGTAFMMTYGCLQEDANNRVASVKDWMAWHFGASDPSLPAYTNANNASNPGFDIYAQRIIRNNGFSELGQAMAQNILAGYVLPGSSRSIAGYVPGGPQVDGCTGVTGGGASAGIPPVL